MGGSQRAFCAAVPMRMERQPDERGVHRERDARAPGTHAPVPRARARRRACRRPSPPSVAPGQCGARSPRRASSAKCSSGSSPASSHSAMPGRRTVSAKARAASRIARCSGSRSKRMRVGTPGPVLLGRVLVEAAAGLPAEAAGRDHLAQQRARAVLRVAEAVVQHFHDVRGRRRGRSGRRARAAPSGGSCRASSPRRSPPSWPRLP